MIRPRYETPENQEQERQIAAVIEKAWLCDVVKLPMAYNLDYAAVRGHEIRSWLEIKRRERTLRQYRCVFLSLQKVFAARHFAAETTLPCYLVIQFDDCLAYADILVHRAIEFRGRLDRGDPQDQEPVVAILPDDFRIVKDTS